ncbi:MAG: type II toxin-antitoxin system RelE family toxin [Ardenticatenaceae bacterium]
MNHLTLPRFWRYYQQLPKEIQDLADKNFRLLKADPYHPSLHFKKVGKKKQLWSVRVGSHYRALGRQKPEGILWFWIGTHAEYDKLLS